MTGASGQLGTLVLCRLAADPHVERIVSIDVAPAFVASPKLMPIVADIRDPDLIQHFLGCEAVIHCAFIVTRGASPEVMRSVNVDGSINVFNAAVAAGIKTIVYMSSITAYGCWPNHPVPIRETTPLIDQPDFPYASCKFQIEAFLDEFEKRHPEVAISRIRANILVGRHMRHLLGKLLHIRWLPDIGGAPLPIVWDEDVADLVVLALANHARGAFNAGADELLGATELAQCTEFEPVVGRRPFIEAYRALCGVLGWFGVHLSDLAWYEKTKGAMLVATSERAKAELGWRPRYPTAKAVLDRFCALVPLGLDVRVQLFLSLARLLFGRALASVGPDDRDRLVRINLCLDGRSGRDLCMQRIAGRLAFKAGPQPLPTSTIQLPDVLFREFLTGAAVPERARRNGDMTVEGNPADWEIFADFVATLVALERNDGLGAFVLRAGARLMGLPKSVDHADCRAVG